MINAQSILSSEGSSDEDSPSVIGFSESGDLQNLDDISEKHPEAQRLHESFHKLSGKLNGFLRKKEDLIRHNIAQVRLLQTTLNKFMARIRAKINTSFPAYWSLIPEILLQIKGTEAQVHNEKFQAHFKRTHAKYTPLIQEFEERVQKIEKQHLQFQKQQNKLLQVNCELVQKALNQVWQLGQTAQLEEEKEAPFLSGSVVREEHIYTDYSMLPSPHSRLEMPASEPLHRNRSDAQFIRDTQKLKESRLTMGPNILPSLIEEATLQVEPFKPSPPSHLIQPCLSEQQFLIFPLKNLIKNKVQPEKKNVQKVGISHFAALIKENTLLITGGQKLTNNRFSSQTQTFKRANKINSSKNLKKCDDMTRSRSQHSICSHYNSPLVFVTGGFVTDPNHYTTHSEVYHWTKDKWEKIEPMLRPLAQHASVTLGQRTVYTFCGSRGHGISHEVKFVNAISRYSVKDDEWMDVKLDDFYDSIPAIGHLTAVELIPNQTIMLFGNGFVKNKGNKTGVILDENKNKELVVRKALVDTAKKVPILNGAERPVLVNWNKDFSGGVIWGFSMLPQTSEFTIMKFEFESEKAGSWVDVGRKEIKMS